MKKNSISVIITGATGMVGEGVLHECLQNTKVSNILVLARKSSGISHPKLKEIIHSDFLDLSPIEENLQNYNACFFCLGVSSIGMSEEEYTPLTYDLTMYVATTLSRLNNNFTFCYVSGAGTDSSEKGRSMWARVKGKTENDLMKLPFKAVYNMRPAVLKPTKGLKRTLKPYTYFGWLIPVVETIFPSYICSLEQLGKAMIYVSANGYGKNILEVKDIISAAEEVTAGR